MVGDLAIIGQQVSVAGATTLVGRLVERLGTPVPGLRHLGLGYAFRTEQASTSSLSYWNLYDKAGSHNVCNFAISSNGTPPPPAAACLLSNSSAWQGNAFAAQTGRFQATFEATPNANNMDAVTRLSNGPATEYKSLAAAVRFNPAGTIDARDGALATLNDEINKLAETLITQVNTLHSAGIALDGTSTG